MPYEPVVNEITFTIDKLPDLQGINQTPFMKLQEANILKSEQQLKLEKSKLYPTINFGYNSATIMGWQTTTQNNERYFGTDNRFSSFNIGLGVPLFNSAQKARVNAGNLAISQNRLEKNAITQQLQSNLKDAITLYLQNKQIVTSYELNILPNSKILIDAATKKIKAGEIGYLEWVMIVNQAIQSKSEYLGYVQQLNEAAFEVEKITLNN